MPINDVLLSVCEYVCVPCTALSLVALRLFVLHIYNKFRALSSELFLPWYNHGMEGFLQDRWTKSRWSKQKEPLSIERGW